MEGGWTICPLPLVQLGPNPFLYHFHYKFQEIIVSLQYLIPKGIPQGIKVSGWNALCCLQSFIIPSTINTYEERISYCSKCSKITSISL